MASSPITSWKIDGEKLEAVTDFIFLGFKITVDGDFHHEIKKHLLLGRKTMTKLDSILKSRHITLQTKVHIDKAMIFPVVMYGCENSTIKKAESRRIGVLKLWRWRRCLRVSWTARGSKQSTLKEHRKKLKSLSHVQLFATPWTVGYQAPPSMEFSRQEYWSG